MPDLTDQLIAEEADEDLTDADIAVMHFAEEWLDAGKDPTQLMQAMADFVEQVVIESVSIH